MKPGLEGDILHIHVFEANRKGADPKSAEYKASIDKYLTQGFPFIARRSSLVPRRVILVEKPQIDLSKDHDGIIGVIAITCTVRDTVE